MEETLQNVSKAAVIGLGSMGWGAALSLLRAGFAVNGCDVRQDVLQHFSQAGGKSCKTPSEAADAAAFPICPSRLVKKSSGVAPATPALLPSPANN